MELISMIVLYNTILLISFTKFYNIFIFTATCWRKHTTFHWRNTAYGHYSGPQDLSRASVRKHQLNHYKTCVTTSSLLGSTPPFGHPRTGPFLIWPFVQTMTQKVNISSNNKPITYAI